jgi:Ca-activated chloride channel family protein
LASTSKASFRYPNAWRAGAFALCAALLASCAAMDSTSSPAGATAPYASNAQMPATPATPAGTHVSFSGAQDIGFLRDQLEAGNVPSIDALDAPGFFAEHSIPLPPPTCGKRLCLQPMVGVMGNLMNGNNCTMLSLALNSPIAADPGERPPLALALAVDVSGSMMGEKIDYVRRGLGLLIDGMRDTDEVALITYSDGVNVVAKMQQVGSNRVALRRAIEGLAANGGTNLHDGLITAYKQVFASYDSARQNRVILLSDGNPTAGITNTTTILADSRTFNSDGVGLTTIGLGSDFNIDLMRGLAQQADGNFYFLEDAGAIDDVFTEELSYFVVPIAFDLQLSLTAGDEYRFGRALGAPQWDNTRGGGQLQIPSVFIAHRESDKDVTAAGGRRGGGSSLLVELMPRPDADAAPNATIATIDLQYREPGQQELQHDQVSLEYPYAPGELEQQGYFAGDDISAVQKSFVMLNIYVGIESAVTAFQSHSADETTIADLDNLIDAVVDYNEEIGDHDIAADLDLLRRLRINMLHAGVRTRTTVHRSNPWPAD